MRAEPGRIAAGATWYVLTGSASTRKRSTPPGVWIGLRVAELGEDVDDAGEVGLCGPVGVFAALIACIERSAQHNGVAEALSAAVDQARATLADAIGDK